MTLIDLTSELADHVREHGVDGEHFPAALRLIAQVWHRRTGDGPGDLRWGMAAGNMLDAADLLFPDPPAYTVLLDGLTGADDVQDQAAVANLAMALATSLDAAARQPGQPRAWDYATAAAMIRTAAQDLS